MEKSICVIGGGASGMIAAIEARKQGADVCVLEHKEQIGKKLLATGNGRCNLTNKQMSSIYYRGEDTNIVETVLKEFSTSDTIHYFKELGLLTKARDNYIYPRTGQASSVRDILVQEMKQHGVHIHTGVHVTDIRKIDKTFYIQTANQDVAFHADKVILSTGGKASEMLGSDGSGYALSASLGHLINPIVPALVPLKTEGTFLKSLAGVRMDAAVTLYIDGKKTAYDKGELQWTTDGISGIPVFQISRFASYAAAQRKSAEVAIDVFPDLKEETITDFLINHMKRSPAKKVEDVLSGILHKKFVPILCTASKIRLRTKMKELTVEQMEGISKKSKHYFLSVTGTMGYQNAQVCAGGVSTLEVDTHTLESKLVQGLYITGELLDIDGMCGGYNLQWAWATGYIAGRHAAINMRT